MIESVGGNRGWIRWLLVWVLYGLKRPQMWVGCDWDKNRNEDWTYRLWPVERSIDQSVAGGKKWESFNYRELFFCPSSITLEIKKGSPLCKTNTTFISLPYRFLGFKFSLRKQKEWEQRRKMKAE